MDDYIPPPPKLVRQVNKLNMDESHEPQQVRPLVWSTLENPEYPSMSKSCIITLELTAPEVPEGIRPNSSYPVYAHMTLQEMCQDLQESFEAIGLLWFRQENKYRWDVRTPANDTRIETGIDVQIFSNGEDRLCVHFQKHYGIDNWRADDLIDQIASGCQLDMSESINPWKKFSYEFS
jgi:hypothetical protein